MAESKDEISVAYDIASSLEAEGYNAKTGGIVLAMALGILAASHPAGHRNLAPLVSAQVKAAQMAFDAMCADGKPT